MAIYKKKFTPYAGFTSTLVKRDYRTPELELWTFSKRGGGASCYSALPKWSESEVNFVVGETLRYLADGARNLPEAAANVDRIAREYAVVRIHNFPEAKPDSVIAQIRAAYERLEKHATDQLGGVVAIANRWRENIKNYRP